MKQLKSIHYLRAIAALMVVIFHIYATGRLTTVRVAELEWLRGGVDLFFVISGFVMVRSTAGRDLTPRQFLTERIQRIVPLYWVATLAAMASIKGEWLLKLGSLLFIPVASPYRQYMQPVVAPGWTLNYEMFFYVLFALTLLAAERHRLWLMLAALGGVILIGLNFQADALAQFYGRPLVLEFVLGMMIARFKIECPVIMIPVGFALMYLLLPMLSDRLYSLGLPAAMVVAGALRAEARLPELKFPALLGDASYSIYLFHMPPIVMLASVWPLVGMGPVAFGLASFVMALAVGCSLHYILERPIIRYFASRRSLRMDFPSEPNPAMPIALPARHSRL